MNNQLIEKEYDFKDGEKGKYYIKDNTYEYAIYVSEENYHKLKLLAKKENKDIQKITNTLIENISIQ